VWLTIGSERTEEVTTMSPRPRRDPGKRPDDRRPHPPAAPTTDSGGDRPAPPAFEPFARFPLRRLGPEWFGPNWLTNTNWFGHWDDLFPTRFPVPVPPGAGIETFRIEEYEEDERTHVIRAEIPGLDPDTDISVEVEDDELTIATTRERRSETQGEVYRSEFSYGTFRRRVRLPAGATADDVTATYDAGVLEIRIRKPQRPESVSIPVRRPE